ncbi:MAG: acetyl-CoA sensor PanZ family protein [Saccharospirillaceae bacterium]|nr:acetyl-CoA sensor PanZ family protein [Saccharospirillaceae bacterium]
MQDIQNGFWVFGIFNERIVGAIFLEKINKQEHIAHYLAVRKPTQNRGVGRELLNRWAKINAVSISFSENLKLIIGDFR